MFVLEGEGRSLFVWKNQHFWTEHEVGPCSRSIAIELPFNEVSWSRLRLAVTRARVRIDLRHQLFVTRAEAGLHQPPASTLGDFCFDKADTLFYWELSGGRGGKHCNDSSIGLCVCAVWRRHTRWPEALLWNQGDHRPYLNCFCNPDIPTCITCRQYLHFLVGTFP